MDRLPKKPPFAIGTRLRCVTTERGATGYGCNNCRKTGKPHISITVRETGMEVVVAEHRPGYRGTLEHLHDEDGPMYYDDTGKPILHTTHDGYCLYKVRCPQCGVEQYGPIISHENKGEWQKL